MATCNISALLESAKCFGGLSKKELNAAIAQLMCNINAVVATHAIIDAGIVTLSGGAATTVASASVSTTTPVLLTYYSLDTDAATLVYQNVVDGVSFDIVSSKPGDTNKVSWAVLRS